MAALEPRPVKLDWPIVAGDDETLTVVIPDLDLTDDDFACHVKVRIDDLVPVVEAVCTSVLAATDTEVTIYLDHTKTRTLADQGSTYMYDLEQDASGVITTWIQGKIKIAKDVTK